MRKAFSFFDRNKNNLIEWFELKAVFDSYDDIVDMFDENDFQTIIREADIDKDGYISYDEFIKMMCKQIEE